MRWNGTYTVSLAVITAIVALSCSGPELADGGSATDVGYTVAGSVKDSTNSPIADVEVVMYRNEKHTTYKISMSLPVDTAHTDSIGAYYFDKILNGEYTVIGSSPSGEEMAILKNVSINGDAQFGSMELRAGAELTGIVNVDINDPVYIVLKNTPYIAKVDMSSRSYGMPQVPLGEYAVATIILDLDNQSTAKVHGRIDTITIENGSNRFNPNLNGLFQFTDSYE
ncbi:MAG: hypothetical protein GF398_10410 [Chitinivibrionales bacterium]|nr:hypothetical protein [Chitinivibrionales bacterium]